MEWSGGDSYGSRGASCMIMWRVRCIQYDDMEATIDGWV
jgi:hypothetical protein